MFITRKEYKGYQAKMDAIIDVQDERLEFLDEKLDSLAKELGLEWTSEAVKVDKMSQGFKGFIIDIPPQIIGQEAVLRWGWKKTGKLEKLEKVFRAIKEHPEILDLPKKVNSNSK